MSTELWNLAWPFLQGGFERSRPLPLHILQRLRGELPVFHDSGHGIIPMKHIGMNEWGEATEILESGEHLAGVGPGGWGFTPPAVFEQRLEVSPVPASSTSDLDFSGN